MVKTLYSAKAVAQDMRDFTEDQIVRIGINSVSEIQEVITELGLVDTGYLRANVFASVGNSVDEPRDKRQRGRQYAVNSAQPLLALAYWKMGDGDIWISIPVSYAAALNNGTPRRPASRFLEKGLGRAVKGAT